MRENLLRIKGCFAALIKRVCSKLSTMDINMKEFRLFIAALFPPGNFLSNMDTVIEVFDAITHNYLWDYYFYSPIEEICKEFGKKDHELTAWISSYKSDLAGFKAATKIAEFISECNDENYIADSEQSIGQYIARYDPRYCRKLAIKLNVQVTRKSLNYIDEFWRSVADHYLLPSLPVLLDSIHSGCAEITWLISPQAATLIEASSLTLDSLALFHRFQVAQISLSNRVIYSRSNVDKVCILGLHYYLAKDLNSSRYLQETKSFKISCIRFNP